MKTFQSYSSLETSEFGVGLAKKILDSRWRIPVHRGALIIALQGDLGAGKTTFTQGFGKGLGITRRMASPTFILMRKFRIPNARGGGATRGAMVVREEKIRKDRKARFKDLYHIDAYRLKKTDGLEVLGLKEIFAEPRNIVLIEWPEKIKKIMPKGVVLLKFTHGKKEHERKITMKG